MSSFRILDGTRVIPTVDNLADSQVVFETRALDFGRPDMDKFIDMIQLQMVHKEAFTNAEVYLAFDDRLREMTREEIDWKSIGKVSIAEKPIHCRFTGRYFALKFIDRTPSERWKLVGIQWYGMLIGRRMV